MYNDNFFSIITVVRDDLEGLKLSRESLILQTYGRWIHIVVDGSISRETQEYLKSLPKQNTIYLSELDNGIYSAMNKGWKLAKPDSFVFYLNAGDKFANSDSLANANLGLKMHGNPQWGCTTHEEISKDGSGWICKLVSAPDIRNQLFAYGYRSHQAVVMRSDLIKDLGGFNEKYQLAADWDLIVRAILHTKPAEWQSPLAVFQLGGVSSIKMIEAHRELMELRKIYLPRTIRMVFFEHVWRAIFLRPLGYVNVFTPIIKLMFEFQAAIYSRLLERKFIKSLKQSTSKKDEVITKFLRVFIKPLEFLTRTRIVESVRQGLSLKVLK